MDIRRVVGAIAGGEGCRDGECRKDSRRPRFDGTLGHDAPGRIDLPRSPPTAPPDDVRAG
jgi:hypothetical protein